MADAVLCEEVLTMVRKAVFDGRITQTEAVAAVARAADLLKQEELDGEVRDALLQEHSLNPFPAPLCHSLSTVSVQKATDSWQKHSMLVVDEVNRVNVGGMQIVWDVCRIEFSGEQREFYWAEGGKHLKDVPELDRLLLIVAKTANLDLLASDFE